VIRLEKLEKTFVTDAGSLRALVGVDLHVAAGQSAGLIGPSGAGKSTLLRCVNLLERPTRGRVFVAGRELTSMSAPELAEARRGIGMIFQHPSLLSARTVFQNVALPLELARRSRPLIRDRVEALLDLVGLSDKRDAYPAQLSGGQRQRVTIARALSTEPALLLCDEATSALDPKTTRAIVELLRSINQRLGITLLVVTHELAVLKQLCDQVALLDQGQVVERCSVTELFSRPRTKLARELVDAALGITLPEEYRARLYTEPQTGSVPLVQLTLGGEAAESAPLSVLARDFGLDVNVVSSHTEFVAGARWGRIVAELRGATADLERARERLGGEGIQWEVLAHVAANGRAPI
jgi:D-methionine transport system ATP-binding protein